MPNVLPLPTDRIRSATTHAVTVRLDDDLWMRLREYCLRHRTTAQAVCTKLLDARLAARPPAPAVTPEPMLGEPSLSLRSDESLRVRMGSRAAAAPQRRSQSLPLPSLDHAAAHAILDATVEVVFTHVRGLAMTRKQWRQKNKAAAVAFVECGWTPARVAALLTFAYTNVEAARYYGRTTMLAKFQEYAPQIADIHHRVLARSGVR